MSDRRVVSLDQRAQALLAEMLDRLSALESLQQLRGEVSLGSMRVGDVTFTVEDVGGDSRNVILTNGLNGLTYTINL